MKTKYCTEDFELIIVLFPLSTGSPCTIYDYLLNIIMPNVMYVITIVRGQRARD